MKLTPTPATPAGEISHRRADHVGLTKSLTEEHGLRPLRVEGVLPEGLEGTLMRVGPGLFEGFGRPYSHLFEGDGAVASVRFEGGRALGGHRLVQSEGLLRERSWSRPLYNTNAALALRALHGITQRQKNSANTSLLPWQGRVFALWEGGPPTELSAEGLETIGTTDLAGVVAGAFSAHPHAVAARDTIYNFGQRVGRETLLDLYELPASGPARHLAALPLARPVMLHDFIATERHLVFFVAPACLDRVRGLLRLGDLPSWWEWRAQEGTEVIVVPLDAPTRPIRFEVGAFWQWHFANAYEDGDTIVVDLVRYDDFSTLRQLSRPGFTIDAGRLCRVRVEPRARRLSAPEPLTTLPCEFPVVDARRAGARCDTIWTTSETDEGNAIACVDASRGRTRAWSCPVGHRPSEALFVPRPGASSPDAGWALSLVYDASRHESYVAVLDAERLEEGPVARAWMGHHVPVTFHGTFVPRTSRL